jgi:hypothetical protein
MDAGPSAALVAAMGGPEFAAEKQSYGYSLSSSYPLIRLWVEGSWTAAAQLECLDFFEAAVIQGSIPMLSVVAIATQGWQGRRAWLFSRLRESLHEKFFRLLKLGSGMELGVYLAGWERGLSVMEQEMPRLSPAPLLTLEMPVSVAA